MAYVSQFGIIMAVSLAGELLHVLLPLAIPASIYGLLLMLVLLCTGVLKLHQVERVAAWLTDLLPLLLVPVSAGLISRWDALRGMLVPFLIVTLAATLLVLAVSGHVTQLIIRAGKGGKQP